MVFKLVIFQYISLIFSPTLNIIWAPFMINEFTIIVKFGIIEEKKLSLLRGKWKNGISKF